MPPQEKAIPTDEAGRYVSPRKKRAKKPLTLQPPLTPMIDVTFQLLLFFLLTTQFRQAEGQIPATLPGGSGEPGPASIEVTIRPAGGLGESALYEITGGNVTIHDPTALYNALEQKRKAISDKAPVQIFPRGDVRWQFVVEAYNQANRAKFEKIAFKTDT